MLAFIFCSRDYLSITYEHDQKSEEYCGNKTGSKIQVTGNYIMIKFHSDDTDQKRGFLINFTALPRSEYYYYFFFWPKREIWFLSRPGCIILLHYVNSVAQSCSIKTRLGMDYSIPVLFPSPPFWAGLFKARLS